MPMASQLRLAADLRGRHVLGQHVPEPALHGQVVGHRPLDGRVEVAVRPLLRVVLPDREEPGLDDPPAQLDRHRGLVDPALLARRVAVQEGRAHVVEALAGLVHQVDGVAHRRGGHVAVRVSLGHHLGQVLRRQLLALGDRLAERRERGHARVGRGRRGLDAGVGVALVVVADEQRVVVAVQRAGDRPEADVRGRAVARHHQDVRVRARVPALPDHRLVAGRHAGGERAAAGDRGVRPRHRVRRAQVGGVGHVHAPGRPGHHGVLAGRLEHPPVLDGRPAARAGPVPGRVRVLLRQVGQVVQVAPVLLEQRKRLADYFVRHLDTP